MLEPKNEQGVVVAFQQICGEMGMEIVSIQSRYPDAIIYDRDKCANVRAEFEFNSDNFKIHKHDPNGADLIICWNKGTIRLPLPVLELSTLTLYPPKLYQRIIHRSPSSESRPRRPISRTVLVVDGVHFYQRVDGSESIIVVNLDDGKHAFSVSSDDYEVKEQKEAVHKILALAKEARDEGGIRDNHTQKAKNLAASLHRFARRIMEQSNTSQGQVSQTPASAAPSSPPSSM